MLSSYNFNKSCPGSHVMGLQPFKIQLGPTYYCNGCKVSFGRGTTLYGCRICDYDLCTRCLSSTSAEIKNYRTCPGNHTVKEFVTLQDGWYCSECKTRFKAKRILYGCGTCNYDLCGRCMNRTSHQTYTNKNCPGNHGLKPFKSPTAKWYCSDCKTTFPSDTPLYGCSICDYDLCNNCLQKGCINSIQTNEQQYNPQIVNQLVSLNYGTRLECINACKQSVNPNDINTVAETLLQNQTKQYTQSYNANKPKRNNHSVMNITTWKNKHINDWNCNELQGWIWNINLLQRVATKVTDTIYEQEITGQDFNSMEDVSDIVDAFEIKRMHANRIFNALKKRRANMKQDIHKQSVVEQQPHVQSTVKTIKTIKLKSPKSKPVKSKHKMKGKLAEKFGHLNIDPTKMKVGAAPAKIKQKSEITNEVVQSNKLVDIKNVSDKNVNVMKDENKPKIVSVNKTYKNKNVKNWNNNDLLEWIKTIGLETQWQEIMIGIIESNGCTGNDWFMVKNFKEFAKKFNITQTMLANRVFREFRKVKRKRIDDNVGNNDIEQNMDKTVKKSIAPPKPVVVNIWDRKHINEWTCDVLKQWIKSLHLNKNNEKKVIESITEQEVSGADFNSIEEAVDLIDSLEINNDCAMKIFTALEKVRKK